MLEVEALDKTCANGTHALRAVSLRVGPGIFGLLGPNGAGKSSLLRTIATLQRPDSGSVRLDGIDLLADQAGARCRIGYLPQDFCLYPQLTAEALLNQFALYKGLVDRSLRARRVAECLERVGEQQARAFDLPMTLALLDTQGRTLLRRAVVPAELAQPVRLEIDAEPARIVLDHDFTLPTAAAPQRDKQFRNPLYRGG